MRDCGVFAVWSSPVVDELSLGTARWRAGLRSRVVKRVCEARVAQRGRCGGCAGAGAWAVAEVQELRVDGDG